MFQLPCGDNGAHCGVPEPNFVLMPLLFAVIPYLAAGGLLWFVATQMAPIGHEVTLSQAIIAVFVIGVCNAVSAAYLTALIGDWRYAVDFVACIIVVMVVLKLSFKQSLLSALIYWLAIFGIAFAFSLFSSTTGLASN